MKQITEVNYYGYVYLAHYGLPHLIKTKGNLAFVSSYSARLPIVLQTFYTSSKAAISAFASIIHFELELLEIPVTVTELVLGKILRTESLHITEVPSTLGIDLTDAAIMMIKDIQNGETQTTIPRAMKFVDIINLASKKLTTISTFFDWIYLSPRNFRWFDEKKKIVKAKYNL